MSGAVADLEYARPCDEGDNFPDPVLPVSKRNRRRHEIIGEGELVIKKMEENAQQGTQW